MTPQERKLIDELFDRLASLEHAPRDADAVRAINEGLQRAPNALYPLVQTVLVQDEALKRADARIGELEEELGVERGQPAKQSGFLDGMRDTLLGKREAHGSVPTVRPAAPAASSAWGGAGQQGGYAPPPQAPMQEPSSGGSFLGTAAAAAAGVVGGALLMNSLRGLFGGHGAAHGAFDPGIGRGTPWGPSAGDSDLARDAGIESIGRGGGGREAYGETQRAGLFDSSGDDGSDLDDGEFDVGDFGGDSDST